MATLNKEYRYNHPVQDIYTVASTEDCFRAKMKEQHAVDIKVESRNGSDVVYTYLVERELPSFIPKMLRKQLEKLSHMSVRQQEKWTKESDSKFVYHMVTELDQMKIRVENTSTFVADGDECVNHIAMTFSCGLPIIGKKLAEYVSEENVGIMDNEYRMLKEYFAEKLSA